LARAESLAPEVGGGLHLAERGPRHQPAQLLIARSPRPRAEVITRCETERQTDSKPHLPSYHLDETNICSYDPAMGYRGKVQEQNDARRLRTEGKTLVEIADALHVSKSSASVWVRDVAFVPSARRAGGRRRRHPWHEAKLRSIQQLDVMGRHLIGELGWKAFLVAGVALYAGEGSKTYGSVAFANTDPAMIEFFCTWLRTVFSIDESRLRVAVYLHQGLDINKAEEFWSSLTGVPRQQFTKPYRAIPDPTIRTNKHAYGCAYVKYSCVEVHRSIMGLVRALLSSTAYSGVAQLAERSAVNRIVEGSSPSPGAVARENCAAS
jgi:hypothetical protein